MSTDDDRLREREQLARVVKRELGCIRTGSFDGHSMCSEHHYPWLSTGECPTQERVTDAIHATVERIVAARERAAERRGAVEALREAADEVERLVESLPTGYSPADASIPGWLRHRAARLDQDGGA